MDSLSRIDIIDILESSETDTSDIEDIPRERIVRTRRFPLIELDDLEFKRRFRINKNTFTRLENVLQNVIEPINERNQPISKANQILICLRFFATGSFQINVADLFNVSQPTVSRIVKKITRHIAALRPQFITMPETEDQRRAVVLGFYNLAQLPGIIGAVDCTHIKIQSPGGENAEVFRNRKSYFSINTQIIGSFDLKIMDIVARWPGSVHDTTIFNDSNIRGRFENNEFSPYCLVGDGGYPCRVYLLTPLQDPQTLPQQRYNNAQIKTRNPVERLFGVWNRRFPCLSLGMRLKLETMCEVIVATAVLHNMCLEQNDTIDFFENGPEIEQIEEIQVRIGYQITATRDSIISAIFTLP